MNERDLQAVLHAFVVFPYSVVIGCSVVCKAETGGKAACQVLKFAVEGPFFRWKKGASDRASEPHFDLQSLTNPLSEVAFAT